MARDIEERTGTSPANDGRLSIEIDNQVRGHQHIGDMRKRTHEESPRSRLLVLVDESNIGSSVRTVGRGLDWLKLREFLAGPNTGLELIEMVVYAGLPPAIPIWQEERDKKNKFMQWLRSNGFMVVTKDGSPAEEGRYKANVDVMMAIDAIELSVEMRPDVVILVTGDADFAYLAIKLRRRGIRVEVASVAQNLGNILRSAANEVIDLAPLFRTFEMMKIQDAVPKPQQQQRGRRSGFRPPMPRNPEPAEKVKVGGSAEATPKALAGTRRAAIRSAAH